VASIGFNLSREYLSLFLLVKDLMNPMYFLVCISLQLPSAVHKHLFVLLTFTWPQRVGIFYHACLLLASQQPLFLFSLTWAVSCETSFILFWYVICNIFKYTCNSTDLTLHTYLFCVLAFLFNHPPISTYYLAKGDKYYGTPHSLVLRSN